MENLSKPKLSWSSDDRPTISLQARALIQDTAWENLLQSRRQVLLRRVAGLLRDYSAARCIGASNVSSTFGGDIGRL